MIQLYININKLFKQGSTGYCQCDYSKTFTDQYGNTQGACRRSDKQADFNETE